MASLTRTTAGQLARETFTSLSGWTNVGSGWAATARAGYVAWPSPRVLLAPGTAGVDADGGGIREPHLAAVSDSNWQLFADAGDGSDPAGANGPWQVKRYSSTDRGLNWTRHGNVSFTHTGSAYAAYSIACLSGWITKVGSTYYMQVLRTNGTMAGGRVPNIPYVNAVYTSSSLTGTWTWSHDSPALGGAGTFDISTAVVGFVVHDGTQYVGWYSAYNGGSQWGIGRVTEANDLGTVWTKDGTGQLIPAAVWRATAMENPKVWNSSVLSRWFMILNGNKAQEESEELLSAPTIDFSTVNVLRYGVMQGYEVSSVGASPIDSANTLSVIAPFATDAGAVVQASGGQVPLVYAGDYPSLPSGFSTLERHQLRTAYLEPYTHVAEFSGGSAVYLTKTQPAQDGVMEFSIEPNTSGSGKNMSFVYRHTTGTSDAGSGYALDFNFNTSVTGIYRLTAGAFTQIGSDTGMRYSITGDSRNTNAIRVRVVLAGQNHKIYVNGRLLFDVLGSGGGFNDSTHAGTLYGFRGVVGPASIRGLTFRTANAVTVNNVPNGVRATLRGYGGYPIDSAVSSGSAVSLSLPYGRAAIVEVDGVDYTPTGGVDGGDVFSYLGSGVATAGRGLHPIETGMVAGFEPIWTGGA